MADAFSDNTQQERFELRRDGVLAAFVQYRMRPGLMALIHTEVDPAFEGQGVGTAIARAVLEDARARGLAVLPFCPFINAYIESHPEYTELVPADHREQFGL